MRIIDGHVHIIGDGSSGSGCWYRHHSVWSKLLEYIVALNCKLPLSSINGSLDKCYVQRLIEQVRSSSLDAVLILAMEIPYDDSGNPLNSGVLYVPNDYVLKLAREYSEFIIDYERNLVKHHKFIINNKLHLNSDSKITYVFL